MRRTYESIYCPQNRRLICWLGYSPKSHIRRDNCPLGKRKWLDMVYAWAKHRDARGLNLSSIPGTHDISDEMAVRKCDINQRFHNSDAVMDFIIKYNPEKQDRAPMQNIMTTEICKDLLRGYKDFKRVFYGEYHREAKRKVEKELKKLLDNRRKLCQTPQS